MIAYAQIAHRGGAAPGAASHPHSTGSGPQRRAVLMTEAGVRAR